MSGSARIHGLLYKSKKLNPSYKLYSPTTAERGELQVLQQINGFINKIGKPIDVLVGTRTFKDIYGANKINGTPKADIALVTYNTRTKKFEEVCFISHKMGRDATGFRHIANI